MSDLVFTGSYKPLDEREIYEFERWLETRLPITYRNFLFRNNGGHPHKHIFPGPYECYIEGFYAITSASSQISLVNQVKKFFDQLPQEVIPIGYTGTGNRVCLSLPDGGIYHWDHEKHYEEFRVKIDELSYLANDIDELLSQLIGDDPPILDDEISNMGRWGDIVVLDKFLERDHNINAVSADGHTIVLYATYAGHLEFLKECVKRGATLNNKGLLHAAIFTMNFELVNYLLDQGLDPNEKDETGQTPLDKALGNGLAVQLLKSKGGVTTTTEKGSRHQK